MDGNAQCCGSCHRLRNLLPPNVGFDGRCLSSSARGEHQRQYIRPFWVAGGLTALIIGYLLCGADDPSMLFHPTTRYLYSHREEPNGSIDNLIPDVFTVGEPREKVVTDLEDAGFERWPLPGDKTGVSEEYHRWAGHAFVCGFELFVKLRFAKDGGLLTAVNQNGGVCL